MNSKTENLLNKAADSSAGTNSVTSSCRVFSSEKEAAEAFEILKAKLLRIENWNAASEISSFAQFDESGNAQPQKTIRVGAMIKVSLPASGKDDWIEIAEIHDTASEAVLTLQPTFDPTENQDRAENQIPAVTSHFFVRASTNNFCLRRVADTISFHVVGLNEETNTADTAGTFETLRNAAVANIGCFFGIQKTQWQIFTANFLEMA